MDVFLGADERVTALVVHFEAPLMLANIPAGCIVEPLPVSWCEPGRLFAYAARSAADPGAARRFTEALLN